tara:strand:- start:4996 stop:5436 length:441 start_codon:yes stop_codon:yes gene_type:complete
MDVAENRLRQLETCSAVYRPNRKSDFQIKDGAIILTHEDIESDAELSAMGNPAKVAWILPINITCIVAPSMDDEVPIDERMNDFVVEAMDALSDPQASWYTFDDLAINAEFTPPVAIEPADDSGRAMTFNCRVTYRVDETSQTTSA